MTCERIFKQGLEPVRDISFLNPNAGKLQTNGKFETLHPYLDMSLATLFAKSTGFSGKMPSIKSACV